MTQCVPAIKLGTKRIGAEPLWDSIHPSCFYATRGPAERGIVNSIGYVNIVAVAACSNNSPCNLACMAPAEILRSEYSNYYYDESESYVQSL